MPQGPILIFDKSSLESLNLNEAVLLDNFFLSNITPLFFVECLADLEKSIRSRSTPEQLVGSLADRTPDAQACANVHHKTILAGELSRQFDIKKQLFRPLLAGGKPVQLGDDKGMIFQRSKEEEALDRWSRREFREVERTIAKDWRQALSQIDLDAASKPVLAELGHWKKPKTLVEAKQITDIIIDNMDPEWLLGFGLRLLGIPEATPWVLNDWSGKRRPPIREHVPYFVFMLSINIFFHLVLPTELLRRVKPSHQVDLAYLYYLPFCMVFTSKDRFHEQIVPLFLDPFQTFVSGDDLKAEMKKLVEHYSRLPESDLDSGLINFAAYPPDETDFLTTRLWDKCLPGWRSKISYIDHNDPDYNKKTIDMINSYDDTAPGVHSHDEHDVDKLHHVTIKRMVYPKKGKWLRFSREVIQQIAKEKEEAGDPSSG
jgi:hypothetical protein